MKKTNLPRRGQIAEEAARLMYEEGVREFLTAKRLAAKRVGGGNRKSTRRIRDLPSNAEIQEALLWHATLAEGPGRKRGLARMRCVAYETMSELEEFSPRLIGSVSTGHVRMGSDIDLHLFSDAPDDLRRHLDILGWDFSEKHVCIRRGSTICDYLHFYLDWWIPIEITLYPVLALRERSRSSTDGRPMHRLKRKELSALLKREHTEEWGRYLREGLGPMMDEHTEAQGPCFPFQSLRTHS